MKITLALSLAGTLAASLGCNGTSSNPPPAPTDDMLANEVAAALIAACPMAAPNDEDARFQCAAKLTDDKFLSNVMQEPFLWGGQKAAGSFLPDESNMNKFNVLVFRRMYLSLMMFPGDMSVETMDNGFTVAHVGVGFRHDLDIGSYPYPFWHSKKKWDSYTFTKELLLLFKDGKWVGAMRSADQDTTRTYSAHTWSGQWHWEAGGTQQPYVTLYSYLLSKDNPHTERLDTAYRALSAGLRDQACFACHSPDNFAASTKLEFFNFPNQALIGRNDIIKDLEMNSMPPENNSLGVPKGIADDGARQELLTLARAFKAAGDDALAYEGELHTTQVEYPASVPH